MKKAKIIGLMAGVMTLVIAIGSTYAWFTSEAGPESITVNAAKIEIESISFEVDEDTIATVLPGEEITVEDLKLTNASTRESVVKITIALNEEESEDGAEVPAPLRSELVTAINGSIEVAGLAGVREGAANPMVILDEEPNTWYIWLDADEDPNDFSFIFTVPEEMGGNVGYFELGDYATPDQENEHLSKMVFTYEAVAVQGTEAAIADYFGPDVAEKFFSTEVIR